MQSRSTLGPRAIAAALFAAALLTGCRESRVAIEPLQLQCVPVNRGTNWSIDAFLKLRVTSNEGGAARLQDDQFALLTGGRSTRPAGTENLKTDSISGQDFFQLAPRYAKLGLMTSRRLESGQSMEAWLHFPDLAKVRARRATATDDADLRRELIEALAGLAPRLQYHGSQGTATFPLDPVTTLPDPLPTHPSELSDTVTVVVLNTGLSGCQLGVLEQRLRAAAFQAGQPVVLSIRGPVDPIVLEWWPPAPGTVTPAALSLAWAPGDQPTEKILDSPVEWESVTRLVPVIGGTRALPNEAQAVAAMLPSSGKQESVAKWSGVEDPAARRLAIEALQPDDPKALDKLLAALDKDPDSGVRIGACETLAKFGEPAVASRRAVVKQRLAAAAEAGDPELRKAAFRTAIALRCAAAVATSAREMVKTGEDSVTAYELLGAAKDKEAVPLLLKRIDEGDSYAVGPLVAIGDTSMLPSIRQRLKTDPANLPGPYVELLAVLGKPEDSKLVHAAWRDDLPAGLRANMIVAMGEFADHESHERLLAVAKNEASDLHERVRAVEALVQFKDKRAVPVFESLAEDQYYRSYCLQGLFDIPGPEATAALQRLTHSNNPSVRHQAERALTYRIQ